MPDSVNLKEFVAGFLLETEEHLHAINRNLVATAGALKRNLPEPRAVRELFRSLHTIKGLSSMVGAEPVVDISHELEGILRTADKAGGRLTEENLDLILQGTRAIEERIRAIAKSGISGIAPAPVALLEKLAAAQNFSPKARPAAEYDFSLPEEIVRSLTSTDREQMIQASRAGRRVVFLNFEPSPEKAARGMNITSVRASVAKIGDLVKVAPRSASTAPTGISFGLLLVTSATNTELAAEIDCEEELVKEVSITLSGTAVETADTAPEVLLPEPETVEWLANDQSTIRVDVRRLDDSLEQLSGLFVTRFKLDRAAAELGARGIDVRELKSVLAENNRQLKRLRTAISEARMVPLADLLQRVPLVVRGITNDSEKSVNVTLQAGSAEVDKSVADKLFPAVIHLVRNAVDHALETRAERKAAGKKEIGELAITCDDSSGTTLILTVTDDGRGVDRDAVAAKAGTSIARSDEELLQQICTAGLSTSRQLSMTSGRGMGMDIVKRTVELLGGSLTLQTTAGQGTSLTLRVPVTVTIVDVLSFLSGGQVFVAPLAVVDEIVEIEPSMAVSLPLSEHRGTQARLIQYRGQTIPLFTLQALLQSREESVIPGKALVVNRGKRAIAFGVDRMLGQQEAVVRPLDDALVRVTGMSGATDLGDGKPTLVLDLASLGNSIMRTAEAVRV